MSKYIVITAHHREVECRLADDVASLRDAVRKVYIQAWTKRMMDDYRHKNGGNTLT